MLIDLITGFVQGFFLTCFIVSLVMIVSFVVGERGRKDD